MTILAGLAFMAMSVGNGPVAGASPALRHLWAVTRDSHGHLRVVRGIDAATASMDNQLGRMSTQVLSYEEDEPVRLLTTNDPIRPQQWALNAVAYESAWSITKGVGVTVAVIDTGVLATHEDLAGSVLPGLDLASDAAKYDPARTGGVDPGGHGTHVAGIIAAHANNGVGITGAAPGVKILPIRVLDASGSGSSSDVADGIIWAADHGARVINLSLGGGPSPGMQTAMQYALTKRVVTVAAAGNSYEAGNEPTYPAAYPEAIAVGAIDNTSQRASFSNTGSYVDVVAPGADIWSTYGKGRTQYADMYGTSMATPYATAVAALVVAANPSLDGASITHAVEASAVDLGARGRDNWYGYGLVNPRGALFAGSPIMINRGTKGHGYWVVDANGRVRSFGGAHFYGDMAGIHLTALIVASARTPDGKGYWLAGADGAIYGFGDAPYLGAMNGHRLNQPIVGMAATPSGRGYILLGRDGGIFGFGDANFYGSTGGMKLNAPVLDLAITASGHGYWFVAADGGVFGFGDAKFHGSTASIKLAQPIRSMTTAADGRGYWMVADDGGIFGFNVPFEGSLPGVRNLYGLPYVSSVRMRALPSTDGYYILGINGTVWAMGNARYFGSTSGYWAVDLMQAP